MGDGFAQSVTEMKTFRAELHVHTVLSPCAEVEMIPPLIIQEALEKGINILAITDHNATANIGAVIKAAEGSGITVLSGMELQTREEVHVLCLFDTLEQALSLQSIVDANACLRFKTILIILVNNLSLMKLVILSGAKIHYC